jgi:hypothetical protein
MLLDHEKKAIAELKAKVAVILEQRKLLQQAERKTKIVREAKMVVVPPPMPPQGGNTPPQPQGRATVTPLHVHPVYQQIRNYWPVVVAGKILFGGVSGDSPRFLRLVTTWADRDPAGMGLDDAEWIVEVMTNIDTTVGKKPPKER